MYPASLLPGDYSSVFRIGTGISPLGAQASSLHEERTRCPRSKKEFIKVKKSLAVTYSPTANAAIPSALKGLVPRLRGIRDGNGRYPFAVTTRLLFAKLSFGTRVSRNIRVTRSLFYLSHLLGLLI